VESPLFIGDGLPVFDIVKFDRNAANTLISSPELGRTLAGLMGKRMGRCCSITESRGFVAVRPGQPGLQPEDECPHSTDGHRGQTNCQLL
jgi:hypothetical protein